MLQCIKLLVVNYLLLYSLNSYLIILKSRCTALLFLYLSSKFEDIMAAIWHWDIHGYIIRYNNGYDWYGIKELVAIG